MTDWANSEAKFASLTWTRVLKVWWALTWRMVLFCFAGGFIMGFIVGLLMVILKMDRQTTMVACQIAGMIISMPIGLYVTKIILQKEFSDFRIALIKKG